MNLQAFFEQIDLHDSGIDNFQYFPLQQKLVLTIEFCHYLQNNYQSNDPETTINKLMFSGVKFLTSNPDINQIKWGEKMNGQILDVMVSKLDNSLDSQIKILLDVTDYIKNIDITFSLVFVASDVSWLTN
jgi:hypothetical protein